MGYDSGYAMGWHDSQRVTSPRHGRTRANHPEYAKGYDHGREDGAKHPNCPEWDAAHRGTGTSALPEGCPWKGGTK